MTFTPSRPQLRGLPYERAELYGKPHINAWYSGSGINTHRYDHESRCALCMRRATNAHHCPPKGKSRAAASFLLETPLGIHVLRPALFALCGTGVLGCHGKIHNGQLRVRWDWDNDGYAQQWWGGHMLMELEPHDPELYRMGRWVFTDDKGRETEVRL